MTGGTAPRAARVELWIARESLADDTDIAARFRALLSDEERARQERFAAETPRRLDLVTRGLQRTLLSRFEPAVAPAEWRFVRSDTGRPSLAPPFDATGLHFNLAHTPGLVAMAIARVPHIGVDVEAVDKKVRLDVARRFFSPPETDALFALPPGEQVARFLRLWTLKESYLKATGAGIAGGLGRMTFAIDAGAMSFECPDDPHASRWMFREFAVAGYLVAVACLDVSAMAPEVTLHEFHGD